MRVEEQVRASIGTMTAAERKTARALLSHYPSAGLAPVAEFARLADTSAPTVLRFVARIGFAGYPDFQRALREEIRQGRLSPLEKSDPPTGDGKTGAHLARSFFERVEANLRETLETIPSADIDAACELIGDARRQCFFVGGRFTDAIAGYLAAHMRIVRPGVRRLDGQVATWRDQLLDVRAGDVFVIFDIRRYQDDLHELARAVSARKARIVLVTDPWLSPVAHYARVVLPCSISVSQTWDSSATLLALSEVLVNRATGENWREASARIAVLEASPKR